MKEYEKEILQSKLINEKIVLKELKQIYNQALKDCEEKIRALSARTDMENLQSIIYQKQYQQAIKGQLEGVLEQLHSNEFNTVSEYLNKCYQEGYISTMYSLSKQGIPLILPIDQNQVVKAIYTDSKLSKTLYESLGENVNKLKTSVRKEISRGISNGSTWNQIATNLAHSFTNTPFNKAYNNSMRIVRTEGNRISNQAAMDSCRKAKSKGADILRQWNSTLDGKTRDTHKRLDGQIREVEEPFEVNGKTAMMPGDFGDPAEDCNCRCTLLQRARWALDDKELETLRERASFFGLRVDDSKAFGKEKAKDFSDFKNKYSMAAKIELKYNNAIKLEPKITEDMKEIAGKLGVDLYGLEYRIKTKESYYEKIQKNGYQYEVKDIIRYTFGTDSPEEYTNNVNAIIENLNKMEYNTIEIKNYWSNDNVPYNGINTTVIEHQGQKFEIQFHTKESYEAKQQMHPLYEKQRKLDDPYSSEYIELTDKMFEIADSLIVPDGARGIKHEK